jgi:diapolycopene oxygenase
MHVPDVMETARMKKSNTAGRVGVIGGGLGGLAAACTLAARGYNVVLFERNHWLGGKAAVLEADGFRFDMGPTILTLPSVLARIFAEAGRRLDDYMELVRIDPQWRSFFADGTTLDLRADVDQMSRCRRLCRGYRRRLSAIHGPISPNASRLGSLFLLAPYRWSA